MKKRTRKLNYIRITSFFARLILGCIFIYASIDKIAYPSEFAKAVQSYNILPEFLIKPVAIFLPWIELIFGILILVGICIRFSTIILSSLLIVFIIVIGIRSFWGPIADCGCFSIIPVFKSESPLVLILRDLIILVFGIILLVFQRNEMGRDLHG